MAMQKKEVDNLEIRREGHPITQWLSQRRKWDDWMKELTGNLPQAWINADFLRSGTQ